MFAFALLTVISYNKSYRSLERSDAQRIGKIIHIGEDECTGRERLEQCVLAQCAGKEDIGMMKKMCISILVVMLVCAAFALSSCGTEEEEPQQEPETTAAAPEQSEEGLYEEVMEGNILIQYPAGWTAETRDGMIYMSRDGSDKPPFFSVEEIGFVKAPETFINNQMEAFKTKYGNQMAQPPEPSTMEVCAGMEIDGFVARYSSDDGSATITRYEYLEIADDIAYHFVCEYVSDASGNQHEDETTYFEFMHAIQTMKLSE